MGVWYRYRKNSNCRKSESKIQGKYLSIHLENADDGTISSIRIGSTEKV